MWLGAGAQRCQELRKGPPARREQDEPRRKAAGYTPPYVTRAIAPAPPSLYPNKLRWHMVYACFTSTSSLRRATSTCQRFARVSPSHVTHSGSAEARAFPAASIAA